MIKGTQEQVLKIKNINTTEIIVDLLQDIKIGDSIV
jgi:hypothetical protein